MDVNNAGFKIPKKSVLQMFYEEGTALDTFVCAQGYTQCVLVSNTDKNIARYSCKINVAFVPQGTYLNNLSGVVIWAPSIWPQHIFYNSYDS